MVNFLGVNAQRMNEPFSPKGTNGMIANFSGFDLSKELVKSGTVNLNLGLSGYYFFIDNLAFCPGVSFGAESINRNDKLEKTLDFTFGLRRWIFNSPWFVGGWYDGITMNNLKYYENGMRFDFGYTKFLSNEFFIEPTIYYQKTFGDLNINRMGFMVSIGRNF